MMSRFHRSLRDVGVALVALAAGTCLDRLLSPHPAWPWYLLVALGAAIVVAVALIAAALHGEREERRLTQDEADKLQAEVDRQSVAANLFLSTQFR